MVFSCCLCHDPASLNWISRFCFLIQSVKPHLEEVSLAHSLSVDTPPEESSALLLEERRNHRVELQQDHVQASAWP